MGSDKTYIFSMPKWDSEERVCTICEINSEDGIELKSAFELLLTLNPMPKTLLKIKKVWALRF